MGGNWFQSNFQVSFERSSVRKNVGRFPGKFECVEKSDKRGFRGLGTGSVPLTQSFCSENDDDTTGVKLDVINLTTNFGQF